MKDGKLWAQFSLFIRLRDSDEHGICKCFTCGLQRSYKQMDAGHGIGRQHQATKYNEQNNNAQCKKCNGFEGGKREVYKVEMDKKYGSGTWDKMEVMSRATCKRGKFEIDIMTEHYRKEVKKLKFEKGLK